jgi:hypothetical protein
MNNEQSFRDELAAKTGEALSHSAANLRALKRLAVPAERRELAREMYELLRDHAFSLSAAANPEHMAELQPFSERIHDLMDECRELMQP